MQRERFPEKVPFRLTRMLVRAMEVSGIEGNYRLTCERVMAVLRDNRQSLLAMLEAFVHDPLISWRLLHPKKAEQADTEESPPAVRFISTFPAFDVLTLGVTHFLGLCCLCAARHGTNHRRTCGRSEH